MFTYEKNSTLSELAWDTDLRTPLWGTLYTYIQLVMPLRKEWKSSPIRVDPQAVIRVEIWRVFKTKLVIILLRAVWIHIVLIWSGFNEIKHNKSKQPIVCCM